MFSGVKGCKNSASSVCVTNRSTNKCLISVIKLSGGLLTHCKGSTSGLTKVVPFDNRMVARFRAHGRQKLGPLRPAVSRATPLCRIQGSYTPVLVLSNSHRGRLCNHCRRSTCFCHLFGLLNRPSIALCRLNNFSRNDVYTTTFPLTIQFVHSRRGG